MIMIFDLNRAHYNGKKVAQGKWIRLQNRWRKTHFMEHVTVGPLSSAFHVLSESESSDRGYCAPAERKNTYFLSSSPRKSHSKREAFYNYVRQMTTTNSIWSRLLSLPISGWIRVHPFRLFDGKNATTSVQHVKTNWKSHQVGLQWHRQSELKTTSPSRRGKTSWMVFLVEQSGECHLKNCSQRKIVNFSNCRSLTISTRVPLPVNITRCSTPFAAEIFFYEFSLVNDGAGRSSLFWSQNGDAPHGIWCGVARARDFSSSLFRFFCFYHFTATHTHTSSASENDSRHFSWRVNGVRFYHLFAQVLRQI